MKKESDLQAHLVKILRSAAAKVLNKRGDFMEGADWADLFVWGKPWTGMLELKGIKTPVKPGQVTRAKELIHVGTPCFFIRLLSTGEHYAIYLPTDLGRPVSTKHKSFGGFQLLCHLRELTKEHLTHEHLHYWEKEPRI